MSKSHLFSFIAGTCLCCLYSCNKEVKTVRQELAGSYDVVAITLHETLEDSTFYEMLTDTFLTDTSIGTPTILTETDDDSTWTDTVWLYSYRSDELLNSSFFDNTTYNFTGCKALAKKCDGSVSGTPTTGGTYGNTFEYTVEDDGNTLILTHNYLSVKREETWSNFWMTTDSMGFDSEVILNLGDTVTTDSLHTVPASFRLLLSE